MKASGAERHPLRLPLWIVVSALVLVAVLSTTVTTFTVAEHAMQVLSENSQGVKRRLGDSWVRSLHGLNDGLDAVESLGRDIALEYTVSATMRYYELLRGLLLRYLVLVRQQQMLLRHNSASRGRPFAFDLSDERDVVLVLVGAEASMLADRSITYISFGDIRGQAGWVRRYRDGGVRDCLETALVGQGCEFCPHCPDLRSDLVMVTYVQNSTGSAQQYLNASWSSGSLMRVWGRHTNGSLLLIREMPAVYDPRVRPWFWIANGQPYGGVTTTKGYRFFDSVTDSVKMGTSLVSPHYVCWDDAVDELRSAGRTCQGLVEERGCGGALNDVPARWVTGDQWRSEPPDRVGQACPSTCGTCAKFDWPGSPCHQRYSGPEACGAFVGVNSVDITFDDAAAAIGAPSNNRTWLALVELDRDADSIGEYFRIIYSPFTTRPEGIGELEVLMLKHVQNDTVFATVCRLLYNDEAVRVPLAARRESSASTFFNVTNGGGVEEEYVAAWAMFPKEMNDWVVVTFNPVSSHTGEVQRARAVVETAAQHASEEATRQTQQAFADARDTTKEARLKLVLSSSAVLVVAVSLAVWAVRMVVQPLYELMHVMGRAAELQAVTLEGPSSRLSEVASMQESLAWLLKALAEYHRFLPQHLVETNAAALATSAATPELHAMTILGRDHSLNETATSRSRHLDISLGMNDYRDAVVFCILRDPNLALDMHHWAEHVLQLAGRGVALEVLCADTAVLSLGAGCGPKMGGQEARQRALETTRKYLTSSDSATLFMGLTSGPVSAGNVGTDLRRQRVVEGTAVGNARQIALLAQAVPISVAAGECVLPAVQRKHPLHNCVCFPGLLTRRVDRIAGIGFACEITVEKAHFPDVSEAWSMLLDNRPSDTAALLRALEVAHGRDPVLGYMRKAVEAFVDSRCSGTYVRSQSSFGAPHFRFPGITSVGERLSRAVRASSQRGGLLRTAESSTFLSVFWNIVDCEDRMLAFVESVAEHGGHVELLSSGEYLARWDGMPAPTVPASVCAAAILGSMPRGSLAVGMASDGSNAKPRGVLPGYGEVVLSLSRSRARTLAAAALQEDIPGLAEGVPTLLHWRTLLPECSLFCGHDTCSFLEGGLSAFTVEGRMGTESKHYASCCAALAEGDTHGARKSLQAALDFSDLSSDAWIIRLLSALTRTVDGGGDFCPRVTHSGIVLCEGEPAQTGERKRSIAARIAGSRSTASTLSRDALSEDEPQLVLLGSKPFAEHSGDVVSPSVTTLDAASPVVGRVGVPPPPPPPPSVGEQQACCSNADLFAKFRSYWALARLVALVYNCVSVPTLGVFGGGESADAVLALFVIDLIADAAYWVDIGLLFNATVEEGGVPVRDKSAIRRNYLYGSTQEEKCGVGWFAVDLCGCLPWEYMLIPWNPRFAIEYRFARVNRLLNLLRFWSLVQTLQESFMPHCHPVKFSIISLLVLLLLVLLWIGCLSMGVMFFHVGDSEAAYEYFGDSTLRDGGTWYETVVAFHWALRGFAGYGQPWPQNTAQYAACLCCNVVGIIMFASVIAYMQTLLGLLGSTYQEYVQIVDDFHSFCNYAKVDSSARDELLSYQRALWHSTRQTRQGQYETVMEQLPKELLQEIRFHSNAKVMASVPELRNQTRSFLIDVLSHMTHLCLPPNETLLHRGDPPRGIFFIHRGLAVVEVEDMPLCTLREGGFWGETAAIFGTPESCSVRILKFTEVFFLPVDTFERVAEGYRDAARLFVETAATRRAWLRQALMMGSSESVPEEQMDPMSVSHHWMVPFSEFQSALEDGPVVPDLKADSMNASAFAERANTSSNAGHFFNETSPNREFTDIGAAAAADRPQRRASAVENPLARHSSEATLLTAAVENPLARHSSEASLLTRRLTGITTGVTPDTPALQPLQTQIPPEAALYRSGDED